MTSSKYVAENQVTLFWSRWPRDKLQPKSRKKELVPGFHRDGVWTPAFAGVTTFYEFIIFALLLYFSFF